jgi:ketosteroid isomerase-like protein
VSPSGKARDFESCIRWFESSHPSQTSGMTKREALDRLFAAWRTGDALRSGAHFAADGVYREARGAALMGRSAIVEHFTKFFRDGPRFEFHVDDTLVEGERAAVRYRFAVEGADGTWRERTGCAFVKFVDGTISEWHEYEG